MGSYMSFTRVTPEELDKATANAERVYEFIEEILEEPRPDDPDGSLDKAWAGLQYLLDAAEVDVEFFMDGHPIDKQAYVHAWFPETVAETARILNETPFDRLATHLDPVAMQAADVYPRVWDTSPDDGCGFLGEAYERLVVFFDHAAETGSGAIMVFSN